MAELSRGFFTIASYCGPGIGLQPDGKSGLVTNEARRIRGRDRDRRYHTPHITGF